MEDFVEWWKENWAPVAFLAGCFIVVGGVIAFRDAQIRAQVEVYQRQGVEMTYMEVLLGAKPVERTIQFKESK